MYVFSPVFPSLLPFPIYFAWVFQLNISAKRTQKKAREKNKLNFYSQSYKNRHLKLTKRKSIWSVQAFSVWSIEHMKEHWSLVICSWGKKAMKFKWYNFICIHKVVKYFSPPNTHYIKEKKGDRKKYIYGIKYAENVYLSVSG